MAGIGFELKKMLSGDSFFDEFSAYLYAAMVSSGPWLISVLCLSVLGILNSVGMTRLSQEIFRATVVYIYAFSLVFVGIIQLVSTRYLADCYYLGEYDKTLSTFFSCLAFTVVVGGAGASAALYFFDLSLSYKIVAVGLFLVVCLIWLAMIFLSTIKDYKNIVYAFAIGAIVSIGAAVAGVRHLNELGLLIGYMTGQTITAFWLMAKLFVEFDPDELWDKDLLKAFRNYWDLMAIGFIYNLAIWSDKFVFWLAPDARMLTEWLFVHDMYEGPVFFSYLTIVPTLAIFLMKIETRFYMHYKNYYAKILDKRSFKAILEEKQGMIDMLQESIREVLIVQGAITFLCLVFAPVIIETAQLIPMQVPLFRISVIGSFLQVCLSMTIIVLFYFDRRKRVLFVASTYLVTNTVFSLITTEYLGFQYYGYGYCYACFVSLLVGYQQMSRTLDNLLDVIVRLFVYVG